MSILKNSQKINALFPEFIQESEPNIFNFLQYYYESLELPFGSLDLIYNLLKYYNIDYYIPSNLVSSCILDGAISPSDTTIEVNTTIGFPNRGYIEIDDEIIYYERKTSVSFENCTRGTTALLLDSDSSVNINLVGSVASSHIDDSTVINCSYAFANEFLNRIKNELIVDFPKKLTETVNFSNLLSNIKDFYQNKGNIASNSFLFKILFNDHRVKLLLNVENVITVYSFPIDSIIRTSTGSGYIEIYNSVTNELILNKIDGYFLKNQPLIFNDPDYVYSIASSYPDSSINKPNAASVEIIPYRVTKSLPKTQLFSSSNEIYYKKVIYKIYIPTELTIDINEPFSIVQTGDDLLNFQGDSVSPASIIHLGNNIYEIECDSSNLYPCPLTKIKVANTNLTTGFNLFVESANGFPSFGTLLINGIEVSYTDRTSCQFINCTSSSLNVEIGDVVYGISRNSSTSYLCRLIQNNVTNFGIILPLLNNLTVSSGGSLYHSKIFEISNSNFSTKIKTEPIVYSFSSYFTDYLVDSRNIQIGITGFYEYRDFYYFAFDGGLSYTPTYGRTLDFINQKYVKRVRKDAGIIHDTTDLIKPTKAIGFTTNGTLLLSTSGNSYVDTSDVTWTFSNDYYLPLDDYGGYQYDFVDSALIPIVNIAESVAPITLDNLPDSFGKKEYLLFKPSVVYLSTFDGGSDHSRIIGWSFDGHPIYGNRGYTSPFDNASPVISMTSGYTLNGSRPTGEDIGTIPLGAFTNDYTFTNTGTLDASNGRYCVTPEFPDGVYAYFITTTYPFIIGETYKSILDTYNITISRTNDKIPNFYKKLITENFTSLNDTDICFSTELGVGSVSSVYIEQGGTGYQLYDQVIVDNTGTGGFGFAAYVSEIGPGGVITEITVFNEGQNYSKLPVVVSIGSTGIDAILQLDSDTIGSLKNISQLSSDIVPSDYTIDYYVDFNYIVRAINNFSSGIRKSLNVGSHIQTETGEGIVKYCNTNDSLLEIQLTTGYLEEGNTITFNSATYGNIRSISSANATLKSLGYSNVSPRYLNNNSHPSDEYSHIQDSFYYQDYSYQLNNTRNYIEYADAVLANTHPIGFKLFGNKIEDKYLRLKNLINFYVKQEDLGYGCLDGNCVLGYGSYSTQMECEAALISGMVTYSDSTFNVADYTTYGLTGTGNASYSFSQIGSGGNPEAFGKNTTTWISIGIYGMVAINNTFTYNPSSGPINTIQWSIDRILIDTFAGANPTIDLFILQDNILYVSNGTASTSLVWSSYSSGVLTQTNFTRAGTTTALSGSSAQPDFSINGSQIRFGIGQIEITSAGLTLGVGFDNLVINVNYVDCP